ncbi:MAG: CHRD domain-containing protein, partial [Planctomycetota bacterium]
MAFAQTALPVYGYSAALEGAQEVPPVATAGRGWGIVRHDTVTNDVRIFVFHESLSGAPVAAHLHLAALGVNGAVIVPLAAASANTYTGVAILSPAQAVALGTSGTYLNVHTPANPGGEIRGQVVPSVSTRYTGVLSGAQEVPPVATAATGTAIAYLHEPENRVVYMVN